MKIVPRMTLIKRGQRLWLGAFVTTNLSKVRDLVVTTLSPGLSNSKEIALSSANRSLVILKDVPTPERLVNKIKSYQALRMLAKVNNEYYGIKRSTEYALKSIAEWPDLADLHLELIQEDMELQRLIMAHTKNTPVNITGEDTNEADRFDNVTSSHAKVRKAQARKLARSLARKYHPDHGGNAEMFKVINDAVMDGDLDLLMFFRMREDFDDFDLKDIFQLEMKIRLKTTQYKAQPSFQMGKDFFMNKERFIANYKKEIRKTIDDLKLKRMGMPTMKQAAANQVWEELVAKKQQMEDVREQLETSTPFNWLDDDEG